MSSSPSFNAIVSRMVSLPRTILGGFSRVMNQGIDLVGMGSRRNHYPHPTQIVQEEWAFLSSFEQHYGTSHPFFYACRFMDALKIAEEEHKFMFMYVHSPEHPFTPSFCRGTICSEVVVQFLDSNFVCWAALASRGEGLQMATALRASTFPFCAVVAPAPGGNLAVLQQIEGPVSPGELMEILQRTMEEQGVAFGSGGGRREEKERADRRLREEQDAACVSSLRIDGEKQRLKNNLNPENKIHNPEKTKQNHASTHPVRAKPAWTSAETSRNIEIRGSKNDKTTQILIRFPNGERREQSFHSKDKIQAIYRYIDSLNLVGDTDYRLISSFPRKVYGADKMGMTLKDSGLHPKSTLFIEIL